jgi:hypothetical protein
MCLKNDHRFTHMIESIDNAVFSAQWNEVRKMF